MDEFNRHYEEYYQRLDEGRKVRTAYFFTATKYGYLSFYPIATGLLLTPFYSVPVWLYAMFHPTTAQWVTFAMVAEKIAASGITAVSVALFYLVSLKVGASRGTSLMLATAYAFATEAWVISSQALWQHGPGVFFILSACLTALGHRENPSRRSAFLVGLLCAVSVAIRPTNIIFCSAMLAWVLYMRPSYLLFYAVPAALLAGALGAYNIAVFGDVRGGYAMPLNANFLEGFSGILFSPGRGLIVYFPLAFLGFAGFYRGLRQRHAETGFFSVLMVSSVVQILVYSKWPTWWGGYCFGPRYLTEIQPMLLLTSIPLLQSWHRGRANRAAFWLLFAWSLGIQATGAFLYPDGRWNDSPVNIDVAPSRAWDWRDNPVSRDLMTLFRRKGTI